MADCAICRKTLSDGRTKVVLGEKGCRGIFEASKARDDSVEVAVGQEVHTSCRKDYCNKKSILKAQTSASSKVSGSETPKTLKLRSSVSIFQFNQHCFFCGQPASITTGRKRSHDVFPVRTMEFQKTIERHCEARSDHWADEVKGRIMSVNDLHAADAVYHQTCSSNFRTLRNRPKAFQSNDSKRNKIVTGRPSDVDVADAFLTVVRYLKDNDDEQITISDLVEKMKEICGDDKAYSAVYMKKKLQEHFGSSILISEINGKTNVVTFTSTASSILHHFYKRPKYQDDAAEKMSLIETAAKLILNDIKSIYVSKSNYPAPVDISSTDTNVSFVPETLQKFLRVLFTAKDADYKVASIGQAIMQAARPRVLMAPLQIGLGIQMHHHFASKFLIDTLNAMGFCCSYSEVQRFETSAASYQGTDILAGIPSGHFFQFIADNVDHNTCTLDGNNTFHGMGIVVGINPEIKRKIAIPRLKVSREEVTLLGKLNIQYFQQDSERLQTLMFEKLVESEIEDRTWKLDLLCKVVWPVKTARPGWSGMMQMVQIGSHPGRSSVYFLPMIDLNPSDISCVYTTLQYICAQASKQGATPVITFDQPLYWKALTIIYGKNSDSCLNNIVLRLGGFHMEMSFLGAIGYIMNGSGLHELLENVYAPNAVDHMLTGKAVSRAVRGHFLVDTAMNALLVTKTFDLPLPLEQQRTDEPVSADVQPSDKYLDQDAMQCTSKQPDVLSTHETDLESSTNCDAINTVISDNEYATALELYNLMMFSYASVESVCSDAVLDNISQRLEKQKALHMRFRTASLWVQYMDMIDVLRTFLKAERTGNWALHLKSVHNMLPYFAASGHNLYLKSAYVYLQHMNKLESDNPDIYALFQSGNHVLRRSDRYWGGLSTDLIIEQVLMRSVKTTGGLTRGRGMNDEQRTQWLLSMPACSNYNSAMQQFTEIEYVSSEQHKDTGNARKQRDQKDTLSLLSYLQERNPFIEDMSLRNIETGVTADETVNADKAKEVGLSVLNKMVGKKVTEYSFKRSDQVVTMNSKSGVKVDAEHLQIDPQLLFQRLISAADRLIDEIPSVFAYELCSYPSSIFDANGLLREAQKPSLANCIWALGDCSVQMPIDERSLHYVLDGGSLIQRLPWNKGTTYSDICMTYVDYVGKRFPNSTIVFDGYSSGVTTKDVTHMRRTKGIKSTTVKFSDKTKFNSKKELFLANSENKQNFINMLSNHFKREGHTVVHAEGDADLLIVLTAEESARTQNTVVVGEDTDLLVLLCFHVKQDNYDLYFRSHSSFQPGKNTKVWDIKRTSALLGYQACRYLPFVHALTGCDTTSRLFGIGKSNALKKSRQDDYFRSQAEVFCNLASTKDEILSAGEEAISSLYGGVQAEGLDFLRYRKFATKVASNTTYVQVHSLPPTSVAAGFHSLRVFLQVQQWIGQGDVLDPCNFGWQMLQDKLLPIKTNKPPAPDCLLKVIRCNCKSNCESKRCVCKKHGLECSVDCGNCRGTSCSNSMNYDISDDMEQTQ